MTDPSALLGLASRVEAGEGSDRELDRAIELAIMPERTDPCPTVELLAYTASLDAAMSLVPEGWVVTLTVYHDGSTACLADDRVHPVRLDNADAEAATPARAQTAACLRARALSPEASR